MNPKPLASPPNRPRWRDGLTRNVFVLGAVSLFTDISSEMIVPVRILFLVGVLNTPLALAGLIEGLAESASSLLKIVSGTVSDRVRSRKPLILFGYGVSNVAKPLLALATTWPPALGFILVDRIGKGVRTSPRDALLADSSPPEYRGKAFGFHRAMDTLGAAIGPLLTVVILLFTHNDLRQVFIWTAVPGLLSVLVLIVFLHERRIERAVAPAATPTGARRRSRREELASLGPRFWLFTAIATVFALGNSSDAFIFLRTEGLEHSLEAVPLVYFGYNLVYALLATPLGALSDRWGRLPVLIAGYTAFGLVYAGWAMASRPWHGAALFMLYGIYAAATEGVARALVTDVVPQQQRGTALGWFNGLTGLAALPANLLGGWLWANVGAGATFALGAWLGLVSAALLLAWAPWLMGARPAMSPREPLAGGS
ncbi:MAG: MFS transporter [Chloroflexi bacterium]|nr:MFS transporter [Chloroflexota bacterium]